MPFESKAQQRFMFAKHPGIAKRWLKESGSAYLKDLPERVEKHAAAVKAKDWLALLWNTKGYWGPVGVAGGLTEYMRRRTKMNQELPPVPKVAQAVPAPAPGVLPQSPSAQLLERAKAKVGEFGARFPKAKELLRKYWWTLPAVWAAQRLLKKDEDPPPTFQP
jgi:hypothetical protein